MTKTRTIKDLAELAVALDRFLLDLSKKHNLSDNEVLFILATVQVANIGFMVNKDYGE